MTWPMQFPEWTCSCEQPVPWPTARLLIRGRVLVGVRHAGCPEFKDLEAP